MRAPGTSAIARCIGCAVVAIVIVVAVVQFRNHDPKPREAADIAAPTDKLNRELARCQALGMAAKDDTACAAAWAENRRRFFGNALSPAAPAANAKLGQPR